MSAARFTLSKDTHAAWAPAAGLFVPNWGMFLNCTGLYENSHCCEEQQAGVDVSLSWMHTQPIIVMAADGKLGEKGSQVQDDLVSKMICLMCSPLVVVFLASQFY